MKQTAVEWLKKELEDYGSSSHLSLDWTTFDELLAQAKEMEKESQLDLIRFMRISDKMGKSVEDLYEQFKSE